MKNNRHYLHVVIIALVFVIGLYVVGITEIDQILAYFGHVPENGVIENDDRGTFGDSTGFINTLFSSLAFAGVILTLYWQIKENSNSREEDHRKQFEDVFFHMTEDLETIIAGLKIELVNPYGNIAQDWELTPENNVSSKQYVEGREVFRYLYEQQLKDGYYMTNAIIASGVDGYERFMEGQLDHYFRYFYRILRYIDDNKLIDNRDKYRYACVLRAHMSSYELLIMHYNGLSSIGSQKLKPLLERYSMLNNIRYEKLANGSKEAEKTFIGEDYYGDSAFLHQWEPTSNKLDRLWNKLIWSIAFTSIITPLILPLWNRIIIDIFVSHISGNSLAILLLLSLLAAYHIYSRWSKDGLLLSELITTDSLSDEKKEVLSLRVVKRCSSLIPVSIILLATIILWIGSNYCLVGKWSIWDIIICYIPIAYEILILIRIKNEVGNLEKVKDIHLFS